MNRRSAKASTTRPAANLPAPHSRPTFRPTRSSAARSSDRIERRFSKIFFLLSFLGGDKKKAADMGVKIGALDWATFIACSLFIGARKGFYALGGAIPACAAQRIVCW
jgi:hypothetical protein